MICGPHLVWRLAIVVVTFIINLDLIVPIIGWEILLYNTDLCLFLKTLKVYLHLSPYIPMATSSQRSLRPDTGPSLHRPCIGISVFNRCKILSEKKNRISQISFCLSSLPRIVTLEQEGQFEDVSVVNEGGKISSLLIYFKSPDPEKHYIPGCWQNF